MLSDRSAVIYTYFSLIDLLRESWLWVKDATAGTSVLLARRANKGEPLHADRPRRLQALAL